MRTLQCVIFTFLLAAICPFVSGQEKNKLNDGKDSSQIKDENAKTVKFEPGEYMLDHVTNKYEWHIITVNHHQVSIPLPIILHSKISGWHVFMSYKLHHGEATYENFKIASEGDNKGKVVEITNNELIKPLDLSFTKVAFSLLISCILLLIVFISIGRKYQKNPDKAPSGLQSALEPMILFVKDDIAKPSIGEKHYEPFMPYLLTIFFFIWFSNMLGLIPIFPGGANVTGNIAITAVLALFTFIISIFISNKHYWIDIVNTPGVPWWLKIPVPLMPLIEILSFFIRPTVLMIRLFANILAGHLVALCFVALIFIFAAIHPALGFGISILSAAFSIFMGLLEILVALIQAYVFTLLSALYFSMAIANPHEK